MALILPLLPTLARPQHAAAAVADADVGGCVHGCVKYFAVVSGTVCTVCTLCSWWCPTSCCGEWHGMHAMHGMHGMHGVFMVVSSILLW